MVPSDGQKSLLLVCFHNSSTVSASFRGSGRARCLGGTYLGRFTLLIQNLPDLLAMLLMITWWKEVIRVALHSVQDKHLVSGEVIFYEWLVGGTTHRSGARWEGETP